MNIEKYMQENSSHKSVMRKYIESHLLDALKRYPTTTQDAILKVITERLEELYLYTVRFPEIVSPNTTRLDILQAILEQFEFQIRREADIEEQINILDNILYVYNRRGSIDTIENMWKYYGGDLPKDVKVRIPSYNIFRYSISKFSGKDVFQDNETYRSDVYEIVLNNNYYPVDDLKEFLLRELVAAGTHIYFTNSIYSLLIDTEDSKNAAYKYSVREDSFVHTHMRTLTYLSGMTWSGSDSLSSNGRGTIWSGRHNLFFEVTSVLLLDTIYLGTYNPDNIISTLVNDSGIPSYHYSRAVNLFDVLESQLNASYTSVSTIQNIERYLYDSNGNLIASRYPGYFILNDTLLGSEVL